MICAGTVACRPGSTELPRNRRFQRKKRSVNASPGSTVTILWCALPFAQENLQMASFINSHALAEQRGEGLRPELCAYFERTPEDAHLETTSGQIQFDRLSDISGRL